MPEETKTKKKTSKKKVEEKKEIDKKKTSKEDLILQFTKDLIEANIAVKGLTVTIKGKTRKQTLADYPKIGPNKNSYKIAEYLFKIYDIKRR